MATKKFIFIICAVVFINIILFYDIKSNCWYKDPQWYITIVTLLVGIGAIFQEYIKTWFFKPELEISLLLKPPDCHKTFVNPVGHSGSYDTYLLRFRVINGGNYFLEDTEVMITELFKKDTNGNYEPVPNFVPLNLVWSNYNKLITMPKIQPTMFKNTDFIYVFKKSDFCRLYGKNINYYNSNIILELATEVKPNMGSHILLPGEYKIAIKFAGNNVDTQTKIYELCFKDEWIDDDSKMLSDNISVNEIS